MSLFLAMETQWRVVAAGGMAGSEMIHMGLDYAALGVVAQAHEVPLDETVMRKLRTMETEALKALGEARKRRAKARSTKAKAQKRKRR